MREMYIDKKVSVFYRSVSFLLLRASLVNYTRLWKSTEKEEKLLELPTAAEEIATVELYL